MREDKWRQKLHIEPAAGWLNDPNGLSFYDGEYRVYFQYSPESAKGAGPRGWGYFHGTSLLDTEFGGMVIPPDIPEDRSGAYSGCGIVHDGLLHLFYTGNVKEEGDFDYISAGRQANVIHVTTKDGKTMSKKEILLRNEDYPEYCSCHVRDPKVWQEDGIWKMVLGARTRDDKGCVLVYHSRDLNNWEFASRIMEDDFGYMWECPDYLTVEGKGFLGISPQGLESFDTKYQNIYQSGYMPVEGKIEENKLGEFTEWDMGFDFYAPQTFEAEDGRRLLIGWMGMPDCDYENLTTELGWQHCMTLPRELTLSPEGKILQNPIRELEARRTSETDHKEGAYFSTFLPFELHGKPAGNFKVCLDERLIMGYNIEEKIFTMQFKEESYGGGRTVRRAEMAHCTDFHMIVDHSSIEIYLNGGERVFSTRFYPEGEQIHVSIQGMDAKSWIL